MNPHDWILLESEVKEKLAKIFRVKRSGFTHVADGKLITDGYTSKDLSVINIDSMIDYLGLNHYANQLGFVELFEKTIAKAMNLEAPKPVAEEKNPILEVIEDLEREEEELPKPESLKKEPKKKKEVVTN